jgi:hypothetical protein
MHVRNNVFTPTIWLEPWYVPRTEGVETTSQTPRGRSVSFVDYVLTSRAGHGVGRSSLPCHSIISRYQARRTEQRRHFDHARQQTLAAEQRSGSAWTGPRASARASYFISQITGVRGWEGEMCSPCRWVCCSWRACRRCRQGTSVLSRTGKHIASRRSLSDNFMR